MRSSPPTKLSSSAQADFHAVEYLSTPCQFCARLCTSDCSKSSLVGGLDRITCAHIFPCYNSLTVLLTNPADNLMSIATESTSGAKQTGSIVRLASTA